MNLFGILGIFLGIIDRLIPLAIAVAVLYFLWGASRYVTASDSDTQAEARGMIVNGIIILFVMVSVWGLVNLVVVSFGIGPTALPQQSINIGGSGGTGSYTGGGNSVGGRVFCWGRGC